MSKIEDAIKRIKSLECPTGEVENRIAGILEEYGVAKGHEVEVKKYKKLNETGTEEFCARILGSQDQSIVILATSGMDDYVAKVVDAYME